MRYGDNLIAVMAPFVTKTMSASRDVVEALSHSPISAVCHYSEIIVLGATPRANTNTIKKTRNQLKIHSNMVIKIVPKSYHIIIRVKMKKINT